MATSKLSRSWRPAACGALLPILAGLAGASPAAAEGALDVTTYGVVWQVPAMATVSVEAALAFGDGDRAFDLYRPAAPPGARPLLPAVVFANIGGARYQDWQIYRDWARLVAAHGMAGVVYQGDPTDSRRSLDRLFTHLRSHARELGLDPARLAVWACSANVSLALPWLNASPRPELAAAVLYYGSTPVAELRTDLPVFYVLAGRDSPNNNAGIRTLFAQAATTGAPWTMVTAPTLTHAFDALDRGVESQRMVKETVAWLVDRLVAPPPPGPAPDLARQALTHSYGQEWDAAAAALRALLVDHPDDRGARVALGSTLARSGQSAAAIPELRRAIALGADDPGVHQNLGQALIATGDTDNGLDELARAVSAGANPAFAYQQPGLTAMTQGAYATAIAVWEAGVSRLPATSPTHRTMLFNLACAYARAGRTDEAFERLGRAIALGFGPLAIVANDEDLASLRADPRFAALLERVSTGS